MRILHLSDLHITTPGETLDTVWNGPAAVLTPPFDFIVVSGDLSQRATDAEYTALADFSRNTLLKLLRVEDPARVVFVPGNHDVNWESPIGETMPFTDYVAREKVTDTRRLLSELQRSPDRAGARHTIRADGAVEVTRVDPEAYPRRFRNVQGFFDNFYEHALGGDHRKFNLTSRDDGRHWSAHVFPEEGVAFYGFSSCHRNDRYWHGATISRLALNRAAEHARELTRKYGSELLRIAVWHHGLTAEPGRPDHLTLLDLGELYNAGFRMGFHGHTHEAAGEILDRFFGDRFIVVSTGSIGAGSEERPDAVGRQFSIVQLYPGQATVQVWERRNVGVYRPSSDARFYLLPQPSSSHTPRMARAELHRRHVSVQADGIAEVSVELRGLIAEGRPTLAVVLPRHGNVSAQPYAETPRGVWPVIRDERPDGRIRFTLASNDPFAASVKWRYRISNAHALHRAELRLVQRDPHWTPEDLAEDEECRGHEIHFPADRLEMVIAYDASLPGLDPDTVRRVVDHRRNDGGNEWWERVPDEVNDRRWHVVTKERHRVELAVDAPLVGHRYTAAYRLGQRANYTLEDEALLIARTVVERTRRERAGGDGFAARLSRALDGSLAELFPPETNSAITVVGSLWHPEEKLLLTSFGRLNHSHWGARFPAGAGVAGHAFRFAATAAWHRRAASETSLIYRPSSEARAIYGTEYPHHWIVSVPILTKTGAAIGVVSFGSREASTHTEFVMATYAERAARGVSDAQFEVNLRFAVNYSFWETLANPSEQGEFAAPPEVTLPSPLRAYAQATAEWLEGALSTTSPAGS